MFICSHSSQNGPHHWRDFSSPRFLPRYFGGWKGFSRNADRDSRSRQYSAWEADDSTEKGQV